MLTPIEVHLRAGDDPADWSLVIRGRPLSVESLLTSAGRTLAEFSRRDQPFAAVSAEVTGSERSVADVLAGPRLRTTRTYAAAPVADLVTSGFPVLATFAVPHVSIVLPRYDAGHARMLTKLLGPERANPYYIRTPR